MGKKKKRQKTPRNPAAKYELIANAGTRCMLCGRECGSYITWHHIKPRYAGGTDSYENASLLCECCHPIIHHYTWGSSEYTYYMEIILHNRECFLEGNDEDTSFEVPH